VCLIQEVNTIILKFMNAVPRPVKDRSVPLLFCIVVDL